MGEEDPLYGKLILFAKVVKLLEAAVGAVFAPTLFSLARISIRHVVTGRSQPIEKNSGFRGQNRIHKKERTKFVEWETTVGFIASFRFCRGASLLSKEAMVELILGIRLLRVGYFSFCPFSLTYSQPKATAITRTKQINFKATQQRQQQR